MFKDTTEILKDVAKKIEKLNVEIEKSPTNKELIENKNTLTEFFVNNISEERNVIQVDMKILNIVYMS